MWFWMQNFLDSYYLFFLLSLLASSGDIKGFGSGWLF